MRLSIRKIGNSQGIILPQALLSQCYLGNEAEVIVKGESLVITKPKHKPREGWKQALQAVAKAGDDKSLLSFSNRFDEEEWEW